MVVDFIRIGTARENLCELLPTTVGNVFLSHPLSDISLQYIN